MQESKLAVVDFSATWCGPCKMLAPVFHELAEEITDVDFFNADVDENRELAEKFIPFISTPPAHQRAISTG